MPAKRKPGQPVGLVEHLNAMAPARPVEQGIGLSRYFMSADYLLRQARSYAAQGNEEQQYVMQMRYVSLVIETIPQHAAFLGTDPRYLRLKKSAREVLDSLEPLRLSLRTKQIFEPHAHSTNRPATAVRLAASNLPQIDWGPTAQPAGTAQPSSNSNYSGFQSDVKVEDLLDIVAYGPGSSAPPASQSQPQHQPTLPYTNTLASAQGTDSNSMPQYLPKYSARQSADASRHALFLTHAQPPTSLLPVPSGNNYSSSSSAGRARPLYPGLDSMRAVSMQSDRQTMSQGQQQQQTLGPYPPAPSAGPPLGPQQVDVITLPADMQGRPHLCTSTSGEQSLPQVSLSQHDQLNNVQSTALVSAPSGPREILKQAGLRDVHVSMALMQDFLAFAQRNTQAGIESCGILAGRLSANDSSFEICTLIIPKQQGTTDTVQALNEEEIFEVQFSQELYPMGWIHTHPTQTCFLSSVDVHTQCGYQTMLDEAVAIVMAPTDKSKRCGIFRLTTPGGLQLVQKCTQRGFHSHPATSTGQELYEITGHVYLTNVKHNVVDLR